MCGISIIIPTTCSKHREHCLLRAIDSALDQADIHVEVIVVANGDRFDHDLFEQLKEDRRLSVIYLPEGNVSQARYHGITQSKHDCFVFLDDDDELLPNTLKHRLDVLNADDSACVVVSNGYFFNGIDRLLVDGDFYKKILESTELSFLAKNWFASPAALYKKSRVDTVLFNVNYQYFEMSYIFFKLIERHYKLVFIKSAAYRCHEDTELSASKSEAYSLAYPCMLRLILEMDLSDPLKEKIRRKYVASFNSLSNYFLQKGDRKKAFLFHIKCLLNGGIGYVSYTRRFLMFNRSTQ